LRFGYFLPGGWDAIFRTKVFDKIQNIALSFGQSLHIVFLVRGAVGVK